MQLQTDVKLVQYKAVIDAKNIMFVNSVMKITDISMIEKQKDAFKVEVVTAIVLNVLLTIKTNALSAKESIIYTIKGVLWIVQMGFITILI